MIDPLATESHEAGHGFGLLHGPDDLRGTGEPGIMAARGTAVDAPYTNNPELGPSGGTSPPFSNTVNSSTRKVKQADINGLGLQGISYDPVTGKGKLGTITNKYHP